jgi:hypothetical protein
VACGHPTPGRPRGVQEGVSGVSMDTTVLKSHVPSREKITSSREKMGENDQKKEKETVRKKGVGRKKGPEKKRGLLSCYRLILVQVPCFLIF